MIKIYVHNSYAGIAEKILYSQENGFSETISKLEEIRDNFYYSCIDISDLSMVVRLFEDFEVVDPDEAPTRLRSGSAVFIPHEQEFIRKFPSNDYDPVAENIWQTWMEILRALNEIIAEFYRYGHTDSEPDIIFLKNVVLFLSDMHVFAFPASQCDEQCR